MSTVNVLKFRTLYSILFRPKFCFFAPSGAVWSGFALFACHLVRHFGIQNFRTFTIPTTLCFCGKIRKKYQYVFGEKVPNLEPWVLPWRNKTKIINVCPDIPLMCSPGMSSCTTTDAEKEQRQSDHVKWKWIYHSCETEDLAPQHKKMCPHSMGSHIAPHKCGYP